MNKQTFLNSFSHIADAPGGIDKLRRLILDLAMQGRLVQQDVSNEPALTAIASAESQRPTWTEETAPARYNRRDSGFPLGHTELPAGWTYSRLGEVLQLVNGRAYKKSEWKKAGTPVIRIQNLNGGDDYYYSDLDLKPHNFCVTGDLLFAWSASFGPYLWKGERAIFHYHIWKVVSSPAIDKKFAFHLLAAMTEAVKFASHGLAMLHMTKEAMEGFVCPIPPLAEQQRIAERVDELMRLCDELEEQQAARAEARATLTAATVHRVAEADQSDDLRAAVGAFADNIGLYLAPGEGDLAALKRVRQAILDLAVRGRLTHRGPDDVPAADLLTRIAAERGHLFVRAKSIRKQTVRQALEEDECPFEVPESWSWARLGDVCQSRLGKMLDAQKNTGTLTPYLRNSNVQWGRFELEDVKRIRLEDTELSEYSLRDGDLLVVEGGEPGRCAIWDATVADGVMVFQKALHRIRPDGGISPRFVALVLRNGVDSGRLCELFTGSTIKHLTGEKLKSFAIPVPPIEEQHRIVESVGQLMSLCDDLEQQFCAARETRRDLGASVVAHATP
ncbi:restriction endonuclease subunit S [Nocardia niigatensis]